MRSKMLHQFVFAIEGARYIASDICRQKKPGQWPRMTIAVGLTFAISYYRTPVGCSTTCTEP